MIDRDDQPRAVIVDDELIEAPLVCDLVREFLNVALYARFSWGVQIGDMAKEYVPERWAEMNAIEEQLRAFIKPGVKLPTREVLRLLREWREAALRVEHEMQGI